MEQGKLEGTLNPKFKLLLLVLSEVSRSHVQHRLRDEILDNTPGQIPQEQYSVEHHVMWEVASRITRSPDQTKARFHKVLR